MDMAVVGVQPVGYEPGQPRDECVKRGGRLPGIDPCPTHADFQIDHDRDLPIKPGNCFRESTCRVGMIDRRAKRRAAVASKQVSESFQVRADERIGQQRITPARRRDHLGLGDRGAFVLADPERFGQPDDLGHLVGLDVRAQPLRSSRKRDHALNVFSDELAVDQERRAE